MVHFLNVDDAQSLLVVFDLFRAVHGVVGELDRVTGRSIEFASDIHFDLVSETFIFMYWPLRSTLDVVEVLLIELNMSH